MNIQVYAQLILPCAHGKDDGGERTARTMGEEGGRNPCFQRKRRVQSFLIFYDEKLLISSRFCQRKLAILTLKINDERAAFANGWLNRLFFYLQ